MALETCKNCCRTIGQLEQAHLWQEQVVCQECHGRLTLSPQPQQAQHIQPPQATYVPVPTYQPPHVQPIEKTGKEWKGLMVISVLAIFIGLPIMISGNEMGAVLVIAGCVCVLISKIGAWWCHG